MHVNPGKEIIEFSWKEFDEAIEQMVVAVKEFGLYDINAVYGVPRGGLIMGVALSHALEIPLIPSLVFYDGKRENLLIVDDISDTGKTLDRLEAMVNNCLFYTLHYDDESIFKPDFYYASNEGCWMKYPWEK